MNREEQSPQSGSFWGTENVENSTEVDEVEIEAVVKQASQLQTEQTLPGFGFPKLRVSLGICIKFCYINQSWVYHGPRARALTSIDER